MTLRSIINRVAAFEPEPFLAPILDAHNTEITTSQKGLVLTYTKLVTQPGWYILRPHRGRAVADMQRYAEPNEIVDYLRALKSILVIALYPVSETTWLVTPYRARDAEQRGWLNGAPLPMHLVRGTVEALDVVTARIAGSALLFDEVNTRVDQREHHDAYRLLAQNVPHLPVRGSQPTDLLNAYQIVAGRLAEAHRQERAEQERLQLEALKREAEAKRTKAEKTVEGRIRSQVEFMGAHLDTWVNEGAHVRVTWTFNGYTHSADFTRELNAVSLGICMNGTDRQHNIATAIAAIDKARELHHHDLNGHWVGSGTRSDLWYDRDRSWDQDRD